jgi:hypothetical protein
MMSDMTHRLKNIAVGLATDPVKYVSSKTHKVLRPSTLRHTLQITSIGGVGTTFLYRFATEAGLNIYRSYDGGDVVSDWGIWKHTRFPIGHSHHQGLEVLPGYRVVYIVGDPRDALMSIYRRGFNYWAIDRLDLSNEDVATLRSCQSLDDYLSHGKDLYQFADHVDRWIQGAGGHYPVMVIKYAAIWSNKDQLLDFMQVPEKSRGLFPEQKDRNSDWSSLDPERRDRICHIYGDLADRIESLPDVQVL